MAKEKLQKELVNYNNTVHSDKPVYITNIKKAAVSHLPPSREW